MLRVIRTDTLDDEVFSSDIGFSDEIDVALGTDLRDAQFLDQQVSRLACGFSGKIKHVIDLYLIVGS